MIRSIERARRGGGLANAVVVAFVVAAGTTAIAVAPTRARAEGRPSYGGAVVGAVRSEPISLEPPLARTQAEIALVTAVCDPLYRVGGNGQVEAHLAASLPSPTPEPHTVRIAIRPGVQFHDGTPVLAADVARALERARRGGGLDKTVQAVAALANDEVLLTLVEPWNAARDEVLLALASPLASIWKPSNEPLVCTGPFVVTRLDRPGRRITLTANEIHFAGRPYIDRVELRWYEQPDAEARAYESGVTQISLRGAIAFTGHRPKFATDELVGPASMLAFIGFGRGHRGALRAPGFGRALSLALDRASFRFVGTGGPVLPTVDPLPPALGGRQASAAESRARRSAAGAALRRAVAANPTLASVASGRAVVSVLVDRTRPDDLEIAQKIASALDRIGVRARIDPVAPGELSRRVAEGRSDLYVGQLAVPARSRSVVQQVVRQVQRRDGARPVALFYRALRVHHLRRLWGLRFDELGALRIADAFYGADGS